MKISSDATAAALLYLLALVSLLSRFTHGTALGGSAAAEEFNEGRARFWLSCMIPWHNRAYGATRHPVNPFQFTICSEVMPYVAKGYDDTGKLNPDYLEALKFLHKKNQTQVDEHICLLSPKRCPPHQLYAFLGFRLRETNGTSNNNNNNNVLINTISKD